MSPDRSEPRYQRYEVLDPLDLHMTGFTSELHRPFDQYERSLWSHHAPTSYPPGILPTHYTAVHNPVGIFSVRDNWCPFPQV